jgi:hypothetical protein
MNRSPHGVQRFKRSEILKKGNFIDRSEQPDIENYSDFARILAEFDGELGNLSLGGLTDNLMRMSSQPSLRGFECMLPIEKKISAHRRPLLPDATNGRIFRPISSIIQNRLRFE